jgi:hypothetical protein
LSLISNLYLIFKFKITLLILRNFNAERRLNEVINLNMSYGTLSGKLKEKLLSDNLLKITNLGRFLDSYGARHDELRLFITRIAHLGVPGYKIHHSN